MEKTSNEDYEKLVNLVEELKLLNKSYETRLNLSGLKVEQMKEDGNCLFRALSYLYFADDSFHLVIR